MTYLKFWIALIGGLAGWGISASEDGLYSQPELWALGLVIATAIGVLQAKNADAKEEPKEEQAPASESVRPPDA